MNIHPPNNWYGLLGDRLPIQTYLDGYLAETWAKVAQTGYDIRPAIVETCPATLREFVTLHAFEVDHAPFSFTNRDYLLPIYEAIRFDRGDHFGLVLMTGAQVTKSITAILTMVFAAMHFWGKNLGYFLPDQEMAMIFSSQRFLPLVHSCLALRPLIGRDPATGTKEEDRKRIRTLGRTSIHFSYMGGKTSTEAIPMQGTWFDEVRRMSMQDIERASERTSAATYPLDVKISTAKHPDADIEYYYKRSSLGKWHSSCRCPEGVVLADTFPDCIGERAGDIFYRCPRCDKKIDRPMNGHFIHHQPEQTTLGYQIPQLLSPLWPAPRFWAKWLNAYDIQEFYNSGLGKPHIDQAAILVPQAVAMGCVDFELPWASRGTHCVMGVDQRGRENHVVVGWQGAAKVELRHLEMIQADDPFERLAELMVQYDIDCCVVDALPNYNEAMRFAKRFPRRVFLAYYAEHLQMIRWSDRDKELQDTIKSHKAAKFEHHVLLDRYKALEWALMHWVRREIACPNPRGLIQEVTVKGLRQPVELCLGTPETMAPGLFWHLRSIARRKVPVPRRDAVNRETIETGELKMTWENIGIDPHFVHALTYMLTAAARRHHPDQMLFLDTPSSRGRPSEVTEPLPSPLPQRAGESTSWRQQVMAHFPQPEHRGTCGGCRNFQSMGNRCQARNLVVTPTLPVGNCLSYLPFPSL